MNALQDQGGGSSSRRGLGGVAGIRAPLCSSILAVLVGLVVSTARSADAQIVTVPPGLAPGAAYRLVFVTSAVRSGASSNVADYNTFVSNAANAVPALAALGTTWKAIAETPSLTAQDNTGTNPLVVAGTPTNRGVPFYRLDGARVADDNPYFWNMIAPLAPISITELGTPAPISVRAPDGSTQAWVWTGVTVGSSKLGSSAPIAAWANAPTANAWIGIAISSSNNGHALYAVSGILHAPQPVPILPVVALAALAANVSIGLRQLSAATRRPPRRRAP